MKITIVTETYLPFIAGVSTSTDNIARFLAQKGHEVTVLCPRPILPVKVHETEFKIIYTPSFKDPFFAGKPTSPWPLPLPIMIKQIKKSKIDILHIQEAGSLGLMALIFAKIRKIPIVGMVHTTPEQMTTLFTNFPFGKITARFIYFFYLQFYRFCNVVIVLTQKFSQFIKKNKFNNQVIIIPNGVDTIHFRPEKKSLEITKMFQIPQDKVLFTFVGRLDIDKNLPAIIKALTYVSENIHFVMIGDGKEKNYLIQLARKLKVDDKISWLFISNKSLLAKTYQTMDCFIITSLIENLSFAMLEALSSGLPVIAPNINAIPELVHDGINGFLINSPYDYRDFAAKMNQIANHPDLRKKMGGESRKIALNYDQQKNLSKLENLYQRIINTPNILE